MGVRVRLICRLCVVSVCLSSPLLAQAPAPMTLEQVNKVKADLAVQEQLGGLLNRAAGCEARMLDIPTLKARIAELEALAKTKTPSQEAPVKP